MNSMESNHQLRSRALLIGALVVGFISGCFVISWSDSHPSFLGKTKPLVERDEVTALGRDTVSYYSMPEDWLHVIADARKEWPLSFEHDSSLGGLRTKVLTVPRIEHGHVELFYPPDKEITFFPRRLAVNHKGKVVALDEGDEPWTGIQMRVYRRPRTLDGVVEWIHKNFKV